jgi:hypothetical protein
VEDPGINWREKIKMDLKKQGMRKWTGSVRLRTGSNGRFL